MSTVIQSRIGALPKMEPAGVKREALVAWGPGPA